MQSTIQQPITTKKLSWRERRAEKKATKLAAKIAKAEAASQVQSATPHPTNFYERAIEWTHRADKVINLALGYLLAIASVLGFMDVLSNGEVLSTVPALFYVWLAIMGLGVDFQILLVIGRMPDLLSMNIGQRQKWAVGLFNAAFLLFLVVMSIVISAVFTEHRDMPVTVLYGEAHNVIGSVTPTIGQSMSTLGINDKFFVYGRAALATLLLVLMAVDRMMERWRMQITPRVQIVTPQVDTSAPIVAPVQASDFLEAIRALQEMNNQNLQAMQELHMRSSQVTVSLIEETFTRLSATLSISGGEVKQLPQGQDTDELEATASPSTSSQGIQSSLAENSYKEAIEQILTQEPNLSDREIAARVGCSVRTANRWKTRMQQPANV